jgi:hypothetical protein
MGTRIFDSDGLTGQEKCVLCQTKDIFEREHGIVIKSDEGDFVCPKCLYGGNKKWKFTVEPHPFTGDVGKMVTDDFDDIKYWIDEDESDEGEYDIKVNFEHESLELYIDRARDEKEENA